jgi:hypothetical protein
VNTTATIPVNPLAEIMHRCISYARKRADFTIQSIIVGPTHRFSDAVSDDRNWGELSVTATFAYRTSPERTLTFVTNLYTWQLPAAFFTVVNAALAGNAVQA